MVALKNLQGWMGDSGGGSLRSLTSDPSGSTAITVSGTHLLTVQEPRVRAKYRGIETTNVSTSCPCPAPAAHGLVWWAVHLCPHRRAR